MKSLYFDRKFEKGTYSVVLRGARNYSTEKQTDLELWTRLDNYQHPQIANVASQKYFRFCDLKEHHCLDNYNPDAQTLEGLKAAMNLHYQDFEQEEIVTLLRFTVL